LCATLVLAGTGLDLAWNLVAVAVIAAYLAGMAGVLGLFLASRPGAYSDARRADQAIMLLALGVVVALLCLALYAIHPRNRLVSAFFIADLLCPVVVGLDSIRRLKPIVAGTRRRHLSLDVRVLAAIVPLAPFFYYAVTVTIGALATQRAGLLGGGQIALLLGLLGVAGLVLASLQKTYRLPRRARLTEGLLVCGIASACFIASIYVPGTSQKVAAIFVVANLLCPVVVGFNRIGRLNTALRRGANSTLARQVRLPGE